MLQVSTMTHMSGRMRPSITPRGSGPDRQAAAEPEPGAAVHDLGAHMMKMIERLTWNIYRIVSVALFASHQLMFRCVHLFILTKLRLKIVFTGAYVSSRGRCG